MIVVSDCGGGSRSRPRNEAELKDNGADFADP